jgi:hypothetical protein
VITQNGSPVGIPLVQNENLTTISSSQVGKVWSLVLPCTNIPAIQSNEPADYVASHSVTKDTVLKKQSCTLNMIRLISLTKQYFPQLAKYLPAKAPDKAP